VVRTACPGAGLFNNIRQATTDGSTALRLNFDYEKNISIPRFIAF
jgi:hypothetical protein